MERNYWGYRIDTMEISYFYKELSEGRLRQGWGWNILQDLRNFQMDEGAGRNKPMFRNVKAGDILLVPQLPDWGSVLLVEATQDWDIGYYFELGEKKDYGHVFPAKMIKSFARANENVSGNIRSTLKNRSRFWNINQFADDIEKILSLEQHKLEKELDYSTRLDNTVNSVFNKILTDHSFEDTLFSKVSVQFTREEWEFALVFGLGKLFPNYSVRRTGGRNEYIHGTDIEIKIPGLFSDEDYVIAIQVKDYEGFVGNEVVEQINRAEQYYKDLNIKLIDKIVLITKAEKDYNLKLIDFDQSVKFIFAKDLKQLLSKIAMTIIRRE